MRPVRATAWLPAVSEAQYALTTQRLPHSAARLGGCFHYGPIPVILQLVCAGFSLTNVADCDTVMSTTVVNEKESRNNAEKEA